MTSVSSHGWPTHAGIDTLDGPSLYARLEPVRALARDYTAAWCSQDASRVASFFEEGGSLTINGGAPAVGRAAIAQDAQGFMTAFPDLVVASTGWSHVGDAVRYHWTLTGTNTGPRRHGQARAGQRSRDMDPRRRRVDRTVDRHLRRRRVRAANRPARTLSKARRDGDVLSGNAVRLLLVLLLCS